MLPKILYHRNPITYHILHITTYLTKSILYENKTGHQFEKTTREKGLVFDGRRKSGQKRRRTTLQPPLSM